MNKGRVERVLSVLIVLTSLLTGFSTPAQAGSWQGPFDSYTPPEGYELVAQGTDFSVQLSVAGEVVIVSHDNDPKWKENCVLELGHVFYINGQEDIVPWTHTECPKDPPDNEWRWRQFSFEGGTIAFDNREDSGWGYLYFKPTPPPEPPTGTASCIGGSITNNNSEAISVTYKVDGEIKFQGDVPANSTIQVSYEYTDVSLHEATLEWNGQIIPLGTFGPCGEPPEEGPGVACLGVEGYYDVDTGEVYGTGQGKNAVDWFVQALYDQHDEPLDKGRGNKAEFRFPGSKDVWYWLRFVGKDGTTSENKGKCVFRPRPVCPTCEGLSPIRESAGQSMAISWVSDEPCVFCIENWEISLHPIAHYWTQLGEFYVVNDLTKERWDSNTIAGDDGSVWYYLAIDDPAGKQEGDYIIYAADGRRIRDLFPANDPNIHKYSSCSLWPSYRDTPNGVATLRVGHNRSDWTTWLLEEGYFNSFEEAKVFVDELFELGQLELPEKVNPTTILQVATAQ